MTKDEMKLKILEDIEITESVESVFLLSKDNSEYGTLNYEAEQFAKKNNVSFKMIDNKAHYNIKEVESLFNFIEVLHINIATVIPEKVDIDFSETNINN